HTMRKSKSKVSANNIFVDGSGEGEGHLSKVQLDRQVMAENGVVIIVFRVNEDTGKLIDNPGIDSRGSICQLEPPDNYSKCVDAASTTYEKGQAQQDSTDAIKLDIKRSVGKIIMQMVNRKPLIMPNIVNTYCEAPLPLSQNCGNLQWRE